MDTFSKQPSEKFTISVDFSSSLETAETIDSYTITAYKNYADVSSQVIDSYSLDSTSKIIYCIVKNGCNGNDYKFTFVATTSNNNIYEKDVIMNVREL